MAFAAEDPAAPRALSEPCLVPQSGDGTRTAGLIETVARAPLVADLTPGPVPDELVRSAVPIRANVLPAHDDLSRGRKLDGAGRPPPR